MSETYAEALERAQADLAEVQGERADVLLRCVQLARVVNALEQKLEKPITDHSELFTAYRQSQRAVKARGSDQAASRAGTR